MKKTLFLFAALLTLLSIYSCKNETLEAKGSPEYFEEIKQWDQKRMIMEEVLPGIHIPHSG